MESTPISVIMSVYKEPEAWLRPSIDSILKQTFSDFEFIIIYDNPSSLGNLDLLKNYAAKDNRIKLIINEENLGLTKSLNRGLAVATGKYVARMDADDISLPSRFEKQYSYMESHPQVIVLGTAIKYIGKGSHLKPIDGIRFGNERIKAQMLMDNCIAHPTVFIRKSILDKHGITYDESYRHSQDYRLWEQLTPYGGFENLRDKLLKYRLSEQQITKSKSSSQAILSSSVKLRLQKAWLDNTGYNYKLDEIERYPFGIIDDIQKDSLATNSLHFSSFVQNAYLCSSYAHKLKRLVIKKEFRHIRLMNLMRIVYHIFLKR